MPPALDRLLASPSALTLLRLIVTAAELPACHTAAQCRAARAVAAKRRTYAKNHGPPKKDGWKRWSEQKAVVSQRQDAVKALLGEAPPTAAKRAKPDAGFDFLNDILGDDENQSLLADEALVEALVEDPDEAWAAKLAHHERLDGLEGIWHVWHARRREAYSLPTENSARAQYLWRTFARHPKLVDYVIEHAAELQQRKGETYSRVYNVVMEYWLVRKPTEALEYHHQMLVKLRLRKLPLRELAQFVQNYGHTAQEALLYIYRNSNERNVYNEVVPRLISAGNISMARRWHNLCTFRGDHPSPSYAEMPVVQVFTAEAAALANPSIRFDRTQRQNPTLNKHLMRRLLGRDTAPVRFEDAFTARMFATRTVQIESIIKGLTMVGVNEIGPLAVSAMAWRTQPITDLPRRFEDLRAAGIALQGSVFSLALEKFAKEQKWDLVQSILESDQHPDVYGDADTQRSLLSYYLEQEDFIQAQRTLAVLSLFHNDASRESWNLLLQLRIKASRPQDAFNTMLEMRRLGTTLSSTTMASVRALLAQRQRGHRPSYCRGFDDLRFVTRFYIAALEGGMARIPPEAWHEIIRRFGMQSRFRELKRLLLWLLSWYAPRHSTEFAGLPRSSFFDTATTTLRRQYPINDHYYNFPADVLQRASESHPVRLLFPPSLQQGILIWGFRASLLKTAPLEQSLLSGPASKPHHRHSLLRKNILTRLHWSVGLRLLVQLRALGVHIHPHTVTKTLQAQFINLFGYGHSRIKANRRMERANTLSYEEYVRQVNSIWGERLFTEPKLLGRGRLDGVLWHPRFRRRVNRGGEVSLRRAMGAEWKDRAGGSGTVDEIGDGGIAGGETVTEVTEKEVTGKEDPNQETPALDDLHTAATTAAAHTHAQERK